MDLLDLNELNYKNVSQYSQESSPDRSHPGMSLLLILYGYKSSMFYKIYQIVLYPKQM